MKKHYSVKPENPEVKPGNVLGFAASVVLFFVVIFLVFNYPEVFPVLNR